MKHKGKKVKETRDVKSKVYSEQTEVIDRAVKKKCKFETSPKIQLQAVDIPKVAAGIFTNYNIQQSKTCPWSIENIAAFIGLQQDKDGQLDSVKEHEMLNDLWYEMTDMYKHQEDKDKWEARWKWYASGYGTRTNSNSKMKDLFDC